MPGEGEGDVALLELARGHHIHLLGGIDLELAQDGVETVQFEIGPELAGGLGIIKPYSFVLENDEKESVAELFVADDDTIIIGGDLMQGLDQDLDAFFKDLMKEE